MTSKLTLALALLCAFLAGIVARDALIPAARADESRGFRAQDVRQLVRAVERTADATKAVAEAVRASKR